MGVFLLSGVTMVVFQSSITHRVQPKLGDARCMMLGHVLRILAFAILLSGFRTAAYLMPMVFSGGGALVMPVMATMASRIAPKGSQGTVQGAVQSTGSLGNAIGPLVAGVLYAFDRSLPFAAAVAAS